MGIILCWARWLWGCCIALPLSVSISTCRVGCGSSCGRSCSRLGGTPGAPPPTLGGVRLAAAWGILRIYGACMQTFPTNSNSSNQRNSVPALQLVGKYNLKLALCGSLGAKTLKTTWITVRPEVIEQTAGSPQEVSDVDCVASVPSN